MKILAAFAIFTPLLTAQSDLNSFKELKYRNIGPFRGGRVVAVSGVTSQPNVYYFRRHGRRRLEDHRWRRDWTPVSDGQFKTGSVGAIGVSESDPNVIYVGMGEPCIRGNASQWRRRLQIHRRRQDLEQRRPRRHAITSARYACIRKIPTSCTSRRWAISGGRTKSAASIAPPMAAQPGSRSHSRPEAGAVDLAHRSHQSARALRRVLAGAPRSRGDLESGGPGSGLFKSTDGGDTWTDLSRIPGLPKGVLGRIGITVSPANSDRVWAMVEAADGGVFRSDNGGKTWTKVNEQNNLRQRAWYYSHIFADPQKC